MSALPKPQPTSFGSMDAASRPASPGSHATHDLAGLKLRCRSHIVIPARLASTRLPQKLLLNETGKSVLQHTHEAALGARLPLGVMVAVDCAELEQEVARFGGRALRTDPDLQCGTDRVRIAAGSLSDTDIIVNVQGDEPEIDGQAIDQVIDLLQSDPSADVATLATPIRTRAKVEDPACVKVVCSHSGDAIYFSRSPVPYPRDWCDSLLQQSPPIYLQHVGLYAYRYDFLMRLEQLPPSPLESTEKLEQLRFLQSGKKIKVGMLPDAPKGIDTMEDYQAFVSRHRAQTPS